MGTDQRRDRTLPPERAGCMGKNKRLATELARAGRVGLDSSILIYHLEGLAPQLFSPMTPI